MKKTLVRAAGVVFAGALITVAAAPAALAQDDPSTVTTTSESPTSTSETPTSTSETSTSATTTTSSAPTSSTSSTTSDVSTTHPAAPVQKDGPPVEAEPDPYKDNFGHGLVGVGGEGVLVIACAAGAPGDLATANLNVTGGPDQDGADGRLWNYTVRVASPPTGPTAPFSWTCAGLPGQGIVEFAQEPTPPTTTTITTTGTTTTTEPPTSSSAPASSTAPITTSTSASGGSSPQAQVKVAPKGGVETGFGGMA